ncbi:MAG: hypothetical protein QW343_00175 [Candidatus Norongarragalinales archaeon]
MFGALAITLVKTPLFFLLFFKRLSNIYTYPNQTVLAFSMKCPAKRERLQSTVRTIRSLTKNEYARRSFGGGAHGWLHVQSVALHARVIAEELALAFGLKKSKARRLGALAEIAGYLHDFARKPREESSGFVEKSFDGLLGGGSHAAKGAALWFWLTVAGAFPVRSKKA